jgi:hypothetical protein
MAFEHVPLANAKPASFDAPASAPNVKPPPGINATTLRAITRGYASVIKDYVEQEIAKATAPLLARISELERRRELRYLGVFRDDGRKYSEGSAVTFNGGIWIALRGTVEKPNQSADWQLAVKSGDRAETSVAHARNGSSGAQPRPPTR